jgi:Methyltransferase domain
LRRAAVGEKICSAVLSFACGPASLVVSLPREAPLATGEDMPARAAPFLALNDSRRKGSAMIKVLRRLFLERPSDPPIALGTARVVRMITFLVVIPIAAMAVLVGGLAPSVAAGASRNMEILWESFLALAHICYLCLAFGDLLLARPIYRIYRQTLVFPGLVFLAYVLFAVSTFETHELLGPLNVGKLLKFLSYLCFFVLYAWWAIRDVLEWRSIYTRRAEKFMWWLVELVSMVVLVAGMRWMLSHSPGESLPWYGNKDVAILFTLGFWSIISLNSSLIRNESLQRVYNDYLDHVEVAGDASLPQIQLPEGGKVLDAGAADGRRLCQILKWLGLHQRPLQVTGFDRDDNEREPFTRHLKEFLGPDSPVKFITDVTEESGFNLVVFSHFIYTLLGLSRAIKILSHCDPGTYVVVRGSSPNSVFQAVSRACSLRLFAPTYGHAWTGSALQRLMRESNLCRVDASKHLAGEMVPDAMVNQSYNLSKGGDPITAIVDYLGHLYGGTVKEEVKEYFQSLAEIRGDQSCLLPNDDIIFVFVKCAPPEQGSSQPAGGTVPAG